MTEKKGRGRPKGSTNKPLMELSTERRRLTNDASVFAILEQCNLVEEDEKAVNGLKHYAERNGAVLPVLQWIFDKNIVSRLPEGKTPYTPNPAPAEDLTESSLRFEFKKFKYFVNDELKDLKREHMWIELLEAIPPREAEMIDLVKDKKNPFKRITRELVDMAFPDVISD
jgi:hypothetical protein